MKKALLLWLLLIGVSHGFRTNFHMIKQASKTVDKTTSATASRTITSRASASSKVSDVTGENPKDSEVPDKEQKKEELIQDTLDELLSVSEASSNSSGVKAIPGDQSDRKNVTAPGSDSYDTAESRAKVNATTKKPAFQDVVSNSTAIKDTQLANKTLAELVKDALEIARETDHADNGTSIKKPVTSVVISKTKLLGTTKGSTSKGPSETSTHKTPTKTDVVTPEVTSDDNSTSGPVTTKRAGAVTTVSKHPVNVTTYSSTDFVANSDDIPMRPKAFANFGAKGPSASGVGKKGRSWGKKGGSGGKKGGSGGKKGGSGGKKKEEAKEVDQTPPAEATQGHLTSHVHGESPLGLNFLRRLIKYCCLVL